jgi:hypothetical protein
VSNSSVVNEIEITAESSCLMKITRTLSLCYTHETSVGRFVQRTVISGEDGIWDSYVRMEGNGKGKEREDPVRLSASSNFSLVVY